MLGALSEPQSDASPRDGFANALSSARAEQLFAIAPR